jgi:hypothetical protein
MPIVNHFEVLKVVIILEFYGDIFSYFKCAILLSNKYFEFFSEIFSAKYMNELLFVNRIESIYLTSIVKN